MYRQAEKTSNGSEVVCEKNAKNIVDGQRNECGGPRNINIVNYLRN